MYQSCGDDEQSLLNYMEGWAKSKQKQDRDWEMIAINSIGMLAYYNLRYDVALLCFNVVATYREQVGLLLMLCVGCCCCCGGGGGGDYF